MDYVLVALRVGEEQARISHSILGVSLLPVLTILVGFLLGWRGTMLATRSWQVIAAGLSHIVLDLLVGVHPMPLLYPFSLALYNLPFGILPSAPLMRLDNSLLYRNLLIEVGVLAPLGILAFLWARRPLSVGRTLVVAALLVLCSIVFMGWAVTLAR